MLDIFKLVDIEAKNRGLGSYTTKLEQVEVSKPYQIVHLDKYLYLFVSQRVDTPALPTRVELRSPDNFYQFTKTTLENSDCSQYQMFSEELEIETKNFGSDDPGQFIPFMLEFLKVIPEVKKEER